MVSRWSGHLSAPLRLNVCRGPCLRKTVVPACRSILRGGRSAAFRRAAGGGSAARFSDAPDPADAAQAASAEKRARLSAVPRRITFAGAIVKRPLRRKPSADRTHALPGKEVAALRETALRTAPRLEAGMRPRQKCVRRRNRRRIGSTASFFSPVRPCAGPDRKLGSAGIPGVAQTGSRRFRALMRPAFFPPPEPEAFRPARLRPCALRPRRFFPRLRGRVPPAGSADRRRG